METTQTFSKEEKRQRKNEQSILRIESDVIRKTKSKEEKRQRNEEQNWKRRDSKTTVTLIFRSKEENQCQSRNSRNGKQRKHLAMNWTSNKNNSPTIPTLDIMYKHKHGNNKKSLTYGQTGAHHCWQHQVHTKAKFKQVSKPRDGTKRQKQSNHF